MGVHTSRLASFTLDERAIMERRGFSLGGRCLLEETLIPVRIAALLADPWVGEDVQVENAWDPHGLSPNIFIRPEDPLVIHRNPVAQSTDCARGLVGVSSGIHAWEIHWSQQQYGSHAVVGVCTREAPLERTGYGNLIGSNQESWGWDLISYMAIYNQNARQSSRAESTGWRVVHPPGRTGSSPQQGDSETGVEPGYVNAPYPRGELGSALAAEEECQNADVSSLMRSRIGEKFIMVLDMDLGTLAFIVDGCYLGLAHTGLRGRTLYPVVNCVWGNCEVRLRYIGNIQSEPMPLQMLCRHTVLEEITRASCRDKRARVLASVTKATSSRSGAAGCAAAFYRDNNDNGDARLDVREDRRERIRRLPLPNPILEGLLAIN